VDIVRRCRLSEAGDRLDAVVLHAELAWRRGPCVDEFGIPGQSVDVRGIFPGAAAGKMEVLGHRIVATRAQWLAA